MRFQCKVANWAVRFGVLPYFVFRKEGNGMKSTQKTSIQSILSRKTFMQIGQKRLVHERSILGAKVYNARERGRDKIWVKKTKMEIK